MQDATTAAAVESELADVLQYLIRLADVLEVDLAEAVRKKVRLNERRFPPGRRQARQRRSSGHGVVLGSGNDRPPSQLLISRPESLAGSGAR
jgi:hypothetical protein